MDLDMWERNNFTAVFTGNYPDKHIYNFLRTKCHTLSKSEDVLVIDVNGQVSYKIDLLKLLMISTDRKIFSTAVWL